MGFYNDNLRPKRSEWEYHWTGKDLLPFTEKLFKKHSEAEIVARNKLADLFKDTNVSQSDRRIEDLKDSIARNGTIKEQCEVWLLEFNRNPDRIFNLGLGDVTFFVFSQP